MGEGSYVLPLSGDTRIRHYHRTHRGRIAEFSLQLEVETGGEWRSVIRYDTAHGKAHIDRFTIAGKKRKDWLHLDFREALIRAERDLKMNWIAYRDRFLRGERP